MMTNYEFKAHDFPQVYENLGIDLRSLGCIMLDTKPLPDVRIDPGVLYHSSDPKKFWIKGQVSQSTPHVTLLYGLLPGVTRSDVDTVLDGRIPSEVFIDNIDTFDSPYEDEPYKCVVAKVSTDYAANIEGPTLTEANERLSLLPHVKTFPGYKAHLTLAYVKDHPSIVGPVVDALAESYSGLLLPVHKLNYGNKIT